MVSARFMENGQFFQSLKECPHCAEDYDGMHAEAFNEIKAVLQDLICRGAVKGDDFKLLADELTQMLVDANAQGHFTLVQENQNIRSALFAQWIESKRTDDPPINLLSALVMGVDPKEYLELATVYSRQHKKEEFPPTHLEVVKKANAETFRVVIISSEVEDNHPTVKLLWSFWVALNKMADVKLLFIDATPDTGIRRSADGPCHRLREELGERYLSCRGRGGSLEKIAADICAEIRCQKSAILFAHGLYQSGADLQREVVRLKPAPLTVQMVSQQGSTGHPSVDFFLTDGTQCPDNREHPISEKLMRISPDMSSFTGGGIRDSHPDYAPILGDDAVNTVRKSLGLEIGVVYMGTFSKYDRFCPYFFDWCLEAAKAAGIRWGLISGGKDVERRLKARAARLGCSDVLHFIEFIDSDKKFLDAMGAFDFFFDSWRFNMHTNAGMVLYSGSILLTLEGTTPASRVGASLLAAHGLSECIYQDQGSLRQQVIRLGQDPAERKRLKQLFLQQRNISPVFDTERFAAEVVAAGKRAWTEYCKEPERLGNVSVTAEDLQGYAEHRQRMKCAKSGQAEQQNGWDSAYQLATELESLGIDWDTMSFPGGKSSSSKEVAIQLFNTLLQLGYSDVKIVGITNDFVILDATYRFSEVTVRITKRPNAEPTEDPAICYAYFILQCTERGKVACAAGIAAWEAASPIDVPQVTVDGRRFSIVSTVRSERVIELEVVLNDLESQFALERQNPPFCQVIDLLYQVLKVVRQCHERGFPLNQDPGKLLLSQDREGRGRNALSKIVHRGVPYQLIVGPVNDCHERGVSGGTPAPKRKRASLAAQPSRELTFDVIPAWKLKETFRESGPAESSSVAESKKAADLARLADRLRKILGVAVDRLESLKIVLSKLKEGDASAESILQDLLFDELRNQESSRKFESLWSLNNVPDWRNVPEYIRQNWYRTFRSSGSVQPRYLHWYVKGGRFPIGNGHSLDLLPMWLVTDAETQSRKVVTTGPGKKGNYVAVYVIRVHDMNNGDQNLRDGRWGMSVRHDPANAVIDGKPRSESDVRRDCELRTVGQYIESSKDKENQHRLSESRSAADRFKAIRNGEKLSNCIYHYLTDWKKNVTLEDIYEKPWLATIAYKLTDDVGPYTELAYPYDWWKQQRVHDATFMVHGTVCPNVRLQRVSAPESRSKIKKESKSTLGMASFS
jgi:hypothetical protein